MESTELVVLALEVAALLLLLFLKTKYLQYDISEAV